MIYLIHGEDEFLRSEAVAARRAELGADESLAAMNTTRFTSAPSLSDLRGATDAMPFLADRRLVIVDNMSRSLEPRRAGAAGGDADSVRDPSKRLKDHVAAFAAQLKALPETTDVVFVEPTIKSTGPLLSAVREARGKIVTATAPRIDSRDLVEWIKGRARHHGARLKDDAVAQALSAYLGNNLRLLDNELEKLALYADGQPITLDDVEALVPQVREAVVFELVDALGTGNPKVALRLLRSLVDEQRESPLYVLAMIVRQFRLMIQVKELAQGGVAPGGIASELKLHPFVAEKLSRQVRGFNLPELRTAFLQLAGLDAGIKHGDLQSAEAAIDAFIVEVARR